MKLWEAPLSSSALTDTAPNETCSCSNLLLEGDKTSRAKTWIKSAENIWFGLYAIVVPLFSFLEQFEVLRGGGYVGCIWVGLCNGVH